MSTMTVIAQREHIALSSILFDTECRRWAVHTGVKVDVFQDSFAHATIKAFNGVSEDGTEPTEILLLDQLCGKDMEERTKWKTAFAKLKAEVPPEPKEALEKHIAVLQEAYIVKRYGEVARDLMHLVETHNPFELSEERSRIKTFVENAFFDIETEGTSEIKQMSLSDGIDFTLQNMKETLMNDTKETVSTGYEELDVALDGGFKKGTFAMIAARPGMGKTVWMLNSSVETSKTGAKVLFVSIEMSLLQCFQRLLAKLADLSSKKIQLPETMLADDWDKITKAAKEIIELHEGSYFVQEITEITIPQLERIIKHYRKLHDIDAVYVDYAQIMLTKDGNEPKDASDFAQISGGLRRASKNQNVAIIVGSQLNRDVEKRVDKKPMMADIRNSGAFEQDAAYIIGLYRDEVYNETSEKPNILELIFLKNRFGKNGVSLEFNYDLERQAIFGQSSS